MADKIEAKRFVEKRLGGDVIIPTLGVWDNPEKIDFDMLPDQFVLKCNHNSGKGMCICTEKNRLNQVEVVKKLKEGLKENYYIRGREWAYKDIPRKVLAEKYMVDESGKELKDYKFFCFNGSCRFFKIDFDRFTDHHANYYNRNKEYIELGEVVCPPDPNKKLAMPQTIDKMIEYAEQLSEGCPFLRVDFYDVKGNIYFGELTLYPASGCGPFIDEKWDSTIGKMLELPNVNT